MSNTDPPGAFNMPWGTRVRVKRAPDGVQLIGATGILCDPEAPIGSTQFARTPGVVALLHVDMIHWAVRETGWEFETVEEPGADVRVALKTEWSEFAERCLAQVRVITGSQDDGYYAKCYARDVSRLVAMLHNIERSNEGAECVSDAWEDTK